MDNTCFGYTIKFKQNKPIEMCAPLHCNDCEGCRFYKRPHILQHELAVADVRNKKIISGAMKTKYKLYFNEAEEGTFDSIEEIDKHLEKMLGQDKEDIYAKNVVKIRKVSA